jgi:hypothetical protein
MAKLHRTIWSSRGFYMNRYVTLALAPFVWITPLYAALQPGAQAPDFTSPMGWRNGNFVSSRRWRRGTWS